MVNQRSAQVATMVRRSLQEMLSRGINDPRVRGLVSIVDVKVTEDLADATVTISVLPELSEPLTLQGLRHAAGHMQAKLAGTAQFRRVPRLRFVLGEPKPPDARDLAMMGGATIDRAPIVGGPIGEPSEGEIDPMDGPPPSDSGPPEKRTR